MAFEFKKLPSQILNIADPYTAYCIDEVCTYIISELRNGRELKKEKPRKSEETVKEPKKSSSVDDYLAYMQSLEF